MMKRIIVLLLAAVLALGAAPVFAAEDMPYSDDYGECRIRINGKSSRDYAYTCRGNVYVSISSLKNYGDASKLSFDKDNLRLEFDASNMNFNFGDEELNAFVKDNAGLCYLPVKNFDPHMGSSKDYYVSLASVAQLVRLNWSLNGNILELENYPDASETALTGTLKGSAASLRSEGARLSSSETVFIIGESNAYYKVKNRAGEVFYVNKSDVRCFEAAEELFDFEYVSSPKDDYSDRKINIAWLNLSDNAVRTALPPVNNGGLDVICYPWVHQTVNGGGSSYHCCDYGIVQLAHQMGYKVWLTVNNSFTAKGSTNYTGELLNDETQYNRLLAQYLLYTCIYNMDGINVDYEDMPKGSAEALSAFCAKLAGFCDRLGLTSSVDTYSYTAYNKGQYDYAGFGQTMDYVIPMLYNENGKSTVGSIESKGWYTKILNNMLEEVPAEKILMGVPFFSRYYYLDADGNNVSSKSGTITMGNAKKKITEKGAVPYWAEKDGQFVVRYPSDDDVHTVTMWLEDEYSMALRMEYVFEHNLAGTACWALYDNDDYIKEVLPMFGEIYSGRASTTDYYKDKY